MIIIVHHPIACLYSIFNQSHILSKKVKVNIQLFDIELCKCTDIESLGWSNDSLAGGMYAYYNKNHSHMVQNHSYMSVPLIRVIVVSEPIISSDVGIFCICVVPIHVHNT